MQQFERSRFDHIGIVTSEKRQGEWCVEQTRVWITSPRAHPFNIEFLRFEQDSPATGPVRTQPHLAYRVEDVHAALEGHDVLLEPFDPSGVGFVEVAFVEVDGVVIEFMQYPDLDEKGWWF